MATNITYHASLPRAERARLRHQHGLTIWFTGLSASGKSTIAGALELALLQRGLHAYRLDGDNVRFGLNRDLGFSARDRGENIRRVAEVARLMADACGVAITSFISPYRADRKLARELHAGGREGEVGEEAGGGLPFVEVYVDVPVEVAEGRDPKGLYAKARAGEIKEFTGVSAPYEAPEAAEVVIKSAEVSVERAVEVIVEYLEGRGLLEWKEGEEGSAFVTAAEARDSQGGFGDEGMDF